MEQDVLIVDVRIEAPTIPLIPLTGTGRNMMTAARPRRRQGINAMKREIVAVLLGASLFLGASVTDAAVIFAHNFNAENGGVGALNYNAFAQWTVTGGTVDHWPGNVIDVWHLFRLTSRLAG